MNSQALTCNGKAALGERSAVATGKAAQSTAQGVRIETVAPGRWDAIAHRFADILPEQTGAFNTSRWGHSNLDCVSFSDGGETFGGAAIIARRIAALGTGIALVKWGPVWQPLRGAADIDRYRAAVDALKRKYALDGNLHLSIMPPASPEHGEAMCRVLRDLGFVESAKLAAPLRYLVNTDQDEEALMASLDQKWRYNLRKSLKAGLEVRFAEDESGLEEFMRLYREMLARKNFHDHSAIDSLPEMMREQPASLRPRIVLVSHQGETTAGGVFFLAGRTASYMFGATDARALKLRAGYAMHWWIAQRLCAMETIDWYDLGGNDLDAGLHQFKKGFVGRTGVMVEAPARHEFAATARSRVFGAGVYALRNAKYGLLKRMRGNGGR